MLPVDPADADVAGRELAVAAEALYLANLMLIPGLGFIVLAVLWSLRHRDAPPLARMQPRQRSGHRGLALARGRGGNQQCGAGGSEGHAYRGFHLRPT